ncbi:TPA: thioredoxin-disulfide reductase [Candidatus Woesearchaeota archaeon]|nr:thioredoxin-disulfide reductase [Candidatus Woesearchaeota archaeon]HIH39851.1 thioredoxin-disulfide reductase [Candidatus Woesearchaeota archaeon]
MEKLVILGAGCAGYTAAIYAARASLSPLILAGKEPGGQLVWTTKVENYPGFPDGVQGPDLTDNMKKQALKFGARIKNESAVKFNILKDGFEIETEKGKMQAKSVIIATGASTRWLNIPSENKFKGNGVHTCATCDGYFYKNKEVAVIGGGDSACEEALFLSKTAKKVTIIHRRDKFRASRIMQDRVRKNKKISIIWSSEIKEIKGKKSVESIIIQDVNSKKTREIKISGIFLAIGHIPNTEIFRNKIKMDDNGFILTDQRMHTSVKGIFASGDVQDPIFKQAATSVGTGCQAAMEAEKYLEEIKDK